VSGGRNRIIVPNFVKIGRSVRYRDIAIFRIFKVAAAAILDFWNHEIVFTIGVHSCETHQRAKFCQNRSIGCEDIKIFPIFRWLPSWIFEIVNFYLRPVSAGPRRTTVPNFVKIACSTVEILRFFEFSRWPPRPSWILEIAKFYWLLGSRGWRRISTPNFVKIG